MRKYSSRICKVWFDSAKKLLISLTNYDDKGICCFPFILLVNMKEVISQHSRRQCSCSFMMWATSFLNLVVIEHLLVVWFCDTIVGDRFVKTDSRSCKKFQVTLKLEVYEIHNKEDCIFIFCNCVLYILFKILFIIIFYWSIVDLQCFRCTAKWFSYTYTYISILFQSLFYYRLL